MSTPLMWNIKTLQERVQRILGNLQPDNLNSLQHVQLVGVFRAIYHDPELIAQITCLHKQKLDEKSQERDDSAS